MIFLVRIVAMELGYCSTRLLSFSMWWIYKFLLIVGWVFIKISLMAEDFISDRSKISGGLKAFGISSVAITYIDMMVLQERYKGTQTHAILRFIFLFWVFMRDYFLHKFLVCHTDQSSTQLLSGFMSRSLIWETQTMNSTVIRRTCTSVQ